MTARELILSATHMGDEPSERQLVVLRFVYNFKCDKGFAPTLREIGASMGIRSTNGVAEHLVRLQGKGCIHRQDMQSRALRILPLGFKWLGVMTNSDHAPAGHAELSDRVLTIQLSRQAMGLLTTLKKSGLFGDDEAEVAQRLLYERLRELAMELKAKA